MAHDQRPGDTEQAYEGSPLQRIEILTARVAELDAQLTASRERAYQPPSDGPRAFPPNSTVVPAQTRVHIAGFPFLLREDALVDGTQGHVNEVLEAQARDRAPEGGHHLETFLRRVPRPRLDVARGAGPLVVRLTSIDQSDVLEGVIDGNTFLVMSP